MFLLVGLGNPGPEYSGTRHNVGFMAIDAIVEANSSGKTINKFKSEMREAVISGEKYLLVKPQTFMNKSGIAIQEIISFYKIPLSNVAVLYDEIALELGRVKVKIGGGDGGHNGIKSLDSHIGREYKRIRIGVGHPGTPEQVSSYVLSDFKKIERKEVDKVITAVAENIDLVVNGQDDKFMNKIVVAIQPPKPKTDKKEGTNGI